MGPITNNPDGSNENREKSWFERIKSLLHIKGAPDTTRQLEHEIQELLEDGEEQGLISSHEERLINSIFDFPWIILYRGSNDIPSIVPSVSSSNVILVCCIALILRFISGIVISVY